MFLRENIVKIIVGLPLRGSALIYRKRACTYVYRKKRGEPPLGKGGGGGRIPLSLFSWLQNALALKTIAEMAFGKAFPSPRVLTESTL